jgi:hypothetical protein
MLRFSSFREASDHAKSISRRGVEVCVQRDGNEFFVFEVHASTANEVQPPKITGVPDGHLGWGPPGKATPAYSKPLARQLSSPGTAKGSKTKAPGCPKRSFSPYSELSQPAVLPQRLKRTASCERCGAKVADNRLAPAASQFFCPSCTERQRKDAITPSKVDEGLAGSREQNKRMRGQQRRGGA